MLPINRNCIIRLSQYRHSINKFKALGFLKIFSDNLAEAVGVTSTQVRKDFSLFKISGNKRGGYDLDALSNRLNEILGKNEIHKCILVGAGKIGTALLKYKGFESQGIEIIAAFDIDPSKMTGSGSIPVLSLEELDSFVKKNHVKIGIITAPDIAAQQIADKLVNSGIKGILNFAPIQLRCPSDVIINNVNLVAELENVIYFVNISEKSKGRQ
ncbi:MAG: redox-sensing transcriptional repressor Rex [Elusimicrobia bacterium]|nr:redox-sensing transcriptional repressor Rex [Candidatus Liberimonas magnetica]